MDEVSLHSFLSSLHACLACESPCQRKTKLYLVARVVLEVCERYFAYLVFPQLLSDADYHRICKTVFLQIWSQHSSDPFPGDPAELKLRIFGAASVFAQEAFQGERHFGGWDI